MDGGIGCGKSAVANLFSQRGISIIDTDEIARDVVKPDQPTLKKLTEIFGAQIIDKNGGLIRSKLADIAFSSEQQRQKLESIIHPVIREQTLKLMQQANSPYVIVVIPLLFETSQESDYDRILVIDCSRETQIARIKNRDNRSDKQIEAIIQSQVSRETRNNKADDIIVNDSSLENLSLKVEELHQKYLTMSQAD
jgi:dephospho-CoA kinase